ncbi:MAG TPA: RpiB/LacA/LacB family sugar-phosphate isomerase [Actinobacteria bacterium]|nr:RpiB/LacA/LacB family sugar-phosphate isomerase [Actinomycetes bacterium]HEX21488.1 RpiB/LacA/LacB family sugar-phosphate isomerase [Actinomycetota bacterium]
MKVFLGTDHAGYNLKEKIKTWLADWGIDYDDVGAHEFNPDDDYPDFIVLAAKRVAENLNENKGIVLGHSGQGEAIAANKIKGIRAIVYYGGTKDIIILSRQHNNANVLSLGAAFLEEQEAKDAIKLWLNTPFSGDRRHIRRIKKIDNIS